MEIVEQYIKSRKDLADPSNEKEYKRVLDLMTEDKPLLEDFAEYFAREISLRLKLYAIK